MRLARPQGPDFDPAEAGHRMFRRDLDGVIDVLALEEIEAGNPFLRFRKRAVGDQELAFSHANRLGLADVVQAITQESASLLVVGRDPFLDVVLGGIEGLARRISTHEQQVAHGASLTFSLSTRESNGTGRNRHTRPGYRFLPSAGRPASGRPSPVNEMSWYGAGHFPTLEGGLNGCQGHHPSQWPVSGRRRPRIGGCQWQQGRHERARATVRALPVWRLREQALL